MIRFVPEAKLGYFKEKIDENLLKVMLGDWQESVMMITKWGKTWRL